MIFRSLAERPVDGPQDAALLLKAIDNWGRALRLSGRAQGGQAAALGIDPSRGLASELPPRQLIAAPEKRRGDAPGHRVRAFAG